MDGLDEPAYEALVTAAETYRAVVVVRLAGEAGLRTGEITRVAPVHLREADGSRGIHLLAVPSETDAVRDETGETADPAGTADPAETTDPAEEPVDRETVVPASLAAELRRYADQADLGPRDPFVGVSPRRVQMIVRETAERAGDAVPDRVTPRDLRRTFARRLLAGRGVDPHAVREAGGWETLGTLDGFLGPLDGEAIAAAVGGEAAGGEDARPAGREPTALAGFEALVDGGGAGPVEAVP
ncbi:tyrosine-type recombinase/integrase, partial [Halorubrum sp. CBA1125]